jgi:hypothetical protein
MLLCCVAGRATAQQFTIRLLDGSSSKPMSNQNVAVSFDQDPLHEVQVAVGTDGIGHIAIPSGANTVILRVGQKRGKEPNRVAYLDCRDQASLPVSLREINQKGFVPRNVCSQSNVTTKPGEIVFWGKARRWWTPDFQ